jgi:hypothetical protein
MKVFYWAMGVLIVGTLLPSAFFWALYAFTGEHVPLRRAQVLWNVSRVLSLAGANVLIWGHVLYGLWGIWFG